jgi:hypothetical protein
MRGRRCAIGRDVLNLPPREPELRRQRNAEGDNENQGKPGRGLQHADARPTGDMRE